MTIITTITTNHYHHHYHITVITTITIMATIIPLSHDRHHHSHSHHTIINPRDQIIQMPETIKHFTSHPFCLPCQVRYHLSKPQCSQARRTHKSHLQKELRPRRSFPTSSLLPEHPAMMQVCRCKPVPTTGQTICLRTLGTLTLSQHPSSKFKQNRDNLKATYIVRLVRKYRMC